MADLDVTNELFDLFFARWYDDEALEHRQFHGVRRDLEQVKLSDPFDLEEVHPLTDEGRKDVSEEIASMFEAALEDWSEDFAAPVEPLRQTLDAFDKQYTMARVNEAINNSDPDDYSNEYVVTCCELGCVLGEAMIRERPSLVWIQDWPYWDSFLFDPEKGYRLNVFHWAIKKMSDYGVDDVLTEKMDACLKMIDQ